MPFIFACRRTPYRAARLIEVKSATADRFGSAGLRRNRGRIARSRDARPACSSGRVVICFNQRETLSASELDTVWSFTKGRRRCRGLMFSCFRSSLAAGNFRRRFGLLMTVPLGDQRPPVRAPFIRPRRGMKEGAGSSSGEPWNHGSPLKTARKPYLIRIAGMSHLLGNTTSARSVIEA